ncbi:MAG TPA: helix-turn-helix domain-containing protein, partial [Thermoanaerobaculia bacterium]|nr:helix-turn-helix domain-containing protein [Thermoanaerobaculia bacterium]
SDVPLLARHLLAGIARRHHREPPLLSDEAAEILAAEPWPGNVRELGNLLERALILADGPTLRAGDVQAFLRPATSPADAANAADAAERETIRQALIEADGDKRRAAEILGLSYRVLLRKVREHDLGGVPRYR